MFKKRSKKANWLKTRGGKTDSDRRIVKLARKFDLASGQFTEIIGF